ncbi:MAG: hypothetical protein JO054_05690, partial [Actinobacteria bacterium]|nr:hypothetical protein [Actinomycetota bacterium]
MAEAIIRGLIRRGVVRPRDFVYRLADRFDQEGMRSLFAPPPVEKHRRLSQEVR